jgi:CO dehydrogenase/acetyl-CoA synthase alpha subunit
MVQMSDYKSDHDRFYEGLKDLAEFREAASRERLVDLRSRIDRMVKIALKTGLASTTTEARTWVIEVMRQAGKLPLDYPNDPSD